MPQSATSHSGIDFRHPYTPYPIQKEFMLALYECIEQGKVGIFESPTGTGKSLSLLCGSITWLRDHKRALFTNTQAQDATDDEPQWMLEHARQARSQDLLQRRNDFEAKLDAIREQERQARRNNVDRARPSKRVKLSNEMKQGQGRNEDFMLDDYDSDSSKPHSSAKRDRDDDLSAETRTLLKRLGGSADTAGDSEDLDESLKVFICSRTHSQLSQLVAELRKVSFPSFLPPGTDLGQDHELEDEQVKQLSLGSRKTLCINDKVKSLANTTLMNESCLELQEKKPSGPAQSCRFAPTKENEAITLDFKHHALSKIRDIEDLASVGHKLGICPYYASRSAIIPAEVVTLPYPLLLQQSPREALKLSVKDHVVIIDEAHNLIDAILGIYTTEISLSQLVQAREQVMAYLQRFRNKLAGKNRVYVAQVLRLLDSIKAYLQLQKPASADGIVSPTTLLSGQGVDQINLHKLMRYMQESKLARKVHGYVDHERQAGNEKDLQRSQAPVLQTFQSFVMALANPAKEGRFFYQTSTLPAESKLKYLLLDPSEHFREIVESARSVILAGGTMAPMADYAAQLLPFLPSSRLTTLSCSHIIPASNLLISTLSTGPHDTVLDFTFASRNSPALLRSLGEALIRLLAHVPDGAVLFLPSYSYLDAVLSAWRDGPSPASTSPPPHSILTRLEALKPVFLDSRAATDTDQLLRDYKTAIDARRGALLLSVIGGRLSEGINFSDGLGRCVVVVGMPYPNPHSAEWKARMEFVEERAAALHASTESRGGKYVGGEASREFAENTCMRAVNQAIGRAIRHKDDWAAVVLVDRRYERKAVRAKLPGWMAPSLRNGGTALGDVEGGLREFYETKRQEGGGG